jgi:hypothetical protein
MTKFLNFITPFSPKQIERKRTMTKSLNSFSTLILLTASALSPLWAENSPPTLNIPTTAIGEENWALHHNPVTVGPITYSDTDAGDILTLAVESAVNGTVVLYTDKFGDEFAVFTPTEELNSRNTSVFSFDCSVNDGTTVTTKTVTITIYMTPIGTTSDSVCDENSSVKIYLTADTDGPVRNFVTPLPEFVPALNGEVSQVATDANGPYVTFTPTPGKNSSNTPDGFAFLYYVNDKFLTVEDTVYITVQAAPAQTLTFLSPVNPLPTVNTVKAGASIPVKFSLGGNFGLNIFAPGYPISQQIVNDPQAPADAIEETVAAGSSGLTYSTATGVYTYVWKTDKNWANTSRQLTIKLTNGTEHKASFKFSK